MNEAAVDILRCPLTGSSLRLEPLERANGGVEYGILEGLGGEYPVVAGIPIFLTGQQDVVALLRKGDFRMAVAAAAVGGRYSNVVDMALKSHPFTNRLRRFTKPMDQRRKQAWLAAAADRLAPRNGGVPRARELYRFAFLECGPASNEAYHYNACRFAMPGYFVALSFLRAIGSSPTAGKGLLLDHSCGSGHLTWAMRRLCPGAAGVVGCDVAFLSLYIARRAIEPDALYVCAEVAQLPFRDGVFSAVFNSDAFNNFSSKLTAFREMARTAASSSAAVLVWLRNNAHPHLYGKPVSMEAYRHIVRGHAYRVYSDDWVLRRFLGKAGSARLPGEELAGQEAICSMWVSKGEDAAPVEDDFGETAIPAECLAINPIYKPKGGAGYERSYPSSFYSREDAAMKFYYPERFTLTRQQQEALEKNQAPELAELLRTGVLVGWPQRFA